MDDSDPPAHNPKASVRPQTLISPVATYVVPDLDELQDSETIQTEDKPELKYHLLVPLARALQCPLCKSIAMGALDKQSPRTSAYGITQHIKTAHKLRPNYGYQCRQCGHKQDTSTRVSSEGGGPLLWIKNHSINCLKAAESAKREAHKGGHMCTDCLDQHHTSNAANAHKDHCTKEKPKLDNGETCKYCDHTKDASMTPQAQPVNTAPPPQQVDTQSNSLKRTMSTPNPFRCLRKTLTNDSNFSPEVIDWALKLCIKANPEWQTISPRNWEHMKQGKETLPLTETIVKGKPFTLFPICEHGHWRLVLYRLHSNGAILSYLMDPRQDATYNKEICDTLKDTVDSLWCKPKYTDLPKQSDLDHVNSGHYIIIYAAHLLNHLDFMNKDTEEIRTNLLEIHEHEIRHKIPRLNDLDLTKHAPRPIAPPLSLPISYTREYIRHWWEAACTEYHSTGAAFNQLEWMTKQLTKNIAHGTRKRYNQLGTQLMYQCPAPQEGDGTAAQTEVETRKKITITTPSQQMDVVSEYWQNRRKVYNYLTEKPNEYCEISTRKLHTHFKTTSTCPSLDNNGISAMVSILPRLQIPQSFADDFTSTEVTKMMKGLSTDSKAGTDGLTYNDWKAIDPNGEMILWIANQCKKHEKIPEHWKQSKVTLIYKQGDKDNPTNWRPITLLVTIYKMYTGLWNNRLNSVKDLLSSAQKGFTSHNGTSEHAALLRDIIDHTRQHKATIALAWLDLENAFGSVPHNLITACIKRYGFPNQFCNIITDLYNGCSTTVMSTKGETEPIDLQCGTKQGDPISSTLFNVCIEILLRGHIKKAKGIQFIGQGIQIMAYADDLVILAPNSTELQRDLHRIENIGHILNLLFNPTKCDSLTIIDGRIGTATVKIRGSTMRALTEKDYYKYLGSLTGFNNRTSIEKIIKTISEAGTNIASSKLTIEMKLDAVKGFILSKTTHLMTISVPKMSDIDTLDSTITNLLKEILQLPKYAPPNYLYSPKPVGGLGFTSFKNCALLQFIIGFLKRCWSKDKFTQQTTRDALIDSLACHTHTPITTLQEAFTILYTQAPLGLGSIPNTTHRLWWIIQHFGTGTNATFHQFELRDTPTGPELIIQAHATSTPVVFNKDKETTMLRKIKTLIALQTYEKWKTNYSFIYSAMATVALSPISNWFNSKSAMSLRNSSMRFIHAARLGKTQLSGDRSIISPTQHIAFYKHCTPDSMQANWDQAPPNRDNYRETLIHVLNCSPQSSGTVITGRHNAIVDILTAAVRSFSTIQWTIEEDCRIPGQNNMLQPDIRFTAPPDAANPGKRKTVVVDVTCPFESRANSLNIAHDNKCSKYKTVIEEYKAKGNPNASFHTIVVGSLGSWFPRNAETFKALGLPMNIYRKLAIIMLTSNIDWSRYIYWRHLMGTRYVEYNLPPPTPMPQNIIKYSPTAPESSTDSTDEDSDTNDD